MAISPRSLAFLPLFGLLACSGDNSESLNEHAGKGDASIDGSSAEIDAAVADAAVGLDAEPEVVDAGGDAVADVDADAPDTGIAPAYDAFDGPFKAREVAVGETHVCALGTHGRVKCWGAWLGPVYGDDADEMGAALPYVNFGTARVKHIAAGGNVTCAIMEDDLLRCWGYGALGVGAVLEKPLDGVPLNLGVGRHAVHVSLGREFGCAVLDDGRVKCWGTNSAGELGQGDLVSRNDLVPEGGEGRVAVELGTNMSTGQKWKAVSVDANGTSVCTLFENAQVKCWGQNSNAANGHGSPDVGGQLCTADAENRGDQPNEMGDALLFINLGTGRTAQAVAMGAWHGCAILDGGGVKCWGRNDSGYLGTGDKLVYGSTPTSVGDGLPLLRLGTGRTAKKLVAGDTHTCALLDDDTVKCWGLGELASLGIGTGATIGDIPDEMGDGLPSVDLGPGRHAVALAARRYTTCALLDDQTIKCWGWNSSGQLGQGDKRNRGALPGEMGAALPAIDLD